MPEGHSIHRYARLHRRQLGGRTVRATSPQGRFAEGARLLDGRVLEAVDAHGKHLFYRWRGAEALHVHLGLYGAFRSFVLDGAPAPPPTAGTRLQLQTGDVIVRLTGPTACELLDEHAEARLRARLGPDPLRRDADPDTVYRALQRRRGAVGAALLDQRVVAGIGNVFRAEALFVCGIDPQLPAAALSRERFDALWATLRRMLRDGVRSGRIVTVDPVELGVASRSRLAPEQSRYVYPRGGLPCRRCGTPIRAWTLAARSIFACPLCQPRC